MRTWSVHIFSSHYLIHFLLSSLGETSCWSTVSWEPDQFIYFPNISPYTSCYLHWEKQVVDQKFHETLISSYIPLTLSHTLPVIFIGRNKLLINSFTRTWSVHIFSSQLSHTLPVIFIGRNKLLITSWLVAVIPESINCSNAFSEIGFPCWAMAVSARALYKPSRVT